MSDHHQADPPPPVGRTWGRLYAIVLSLLAAEIFIFWMFTRAFA